MAAPPPPPAAPPPPAVKLQLIDDLSAGIDESVLQDVKEALSVMIDSPNSSSKLNSPNRFGYILIALSHGLAEENAMCCAHIIANNVQKMMGLKLQRGSIDATKKMTFYLLDFTCPLMFETAEVISGASEISLLSLPAYMAPNFQHKDNVKLNKGTYKLYKKFQNGSFVYLYNFTKTTAASDVSYANLELTSAAVTGPTFVEEIAIIKHLPSEAVYHKFTISNKGLGIGEHNKAIAEATKTAAKTAVETTLDTLKRTIAISPEIEHSVLSGVIPQTEVTLEFRSLDVIIPFHETDCTKQFFMYAKNFYPKLEIVSEESFQEIISRYALSRENLAIYSKARETCYVVGEDIDVDELYGYAAEGEYQLLANMAKASAMIAHARIMEQRLFSKTNVIGLLMNYDNDEVVKIFKMECDFIAGTTTITKALSKEKIDKMLARINYQLNNY